MSWTLLLFLFFDQSIFVELVIYILCASVDEDEQQRQLQQHRLGTIGYDLQLKDLLIDFTHTHTCTHSAGNQLVPGWDLTIQPASQSSLLLLLWQDAVINYVWERRCECVCSFFFCFLRKDKSSCRCFFKATKKVLTFLSLSFKWYFLFLLFTFTTTFFWLSVGLSTF